MRNAAAQQAMVTGNALAAVPSARYCSGKLRSNQNRLVSHRA